LFGLFLIFVCQCKFNHKSQSVYIGGIIKNVENQQLKINDNEIAINKEGRFEYRFELQKASYINFKLDNEIALFLEPGDSLFLKLNAEQFYETLKAAGKGEEVNQFLINVNIEAIKLTEYFQQHYREIFTLGEKSFIHKMDSIRSVFDHLINQFIKENNYKNKYFIKSQRVMVQYSWAEMLLNYPNWYRHFTRNEDIEFSENYYNFINLLDFNDPESMSVDEYRSFLNSYVEVRAKKELKENPIFRDKNYKQIRAKVYVIIQTFTDPKIKSEMLFSIMKPFISEYNAKGIDDLITLFRKNCSEQKYIDKIEQIINRDKEIREQCEILVYKTIDDITLDALVYRPAILKSYEKRPAIAFFHGGGWYCGKPEWGHFQCSHFSSKGMVAISFEYRLQEQHDATPLEGIADAKSAIRWMRKYSDDLNIDPNRIIASGFSAGGHLSACTVMIDKFDEPSEDLSISSAANALMLWAPAVKIYEGFKSRLKNRAEIKDVDPASHIRHGLPPTIIFQGDQDEQVPFRSVKDFSWRMELAGNRCDLHMYKGQTHLIWGKNNDDVLEKMDKF
jgi:acetyl esterase/lipase